MKITGTRSYITVEIDEKKIKIKGELTATPIFYAEVSSITNWEPPHDHIPISESEKNELIKRIVNESKDLNIPIVFD